MKFSSSLHVCIRSVDMEVLEKHNPESASFQVTGFEVLVSSEKKPSNYNHVDVDISKQASWKSS